MALDKDMATIAFLNTHIQPIKHDELYELSKGEFMVGYALGVADEKERAIKAVYDAGGDNCEYHIEAIRKGGE